MESHLNLGNLKDGLIAIPALHALACLTYLLFYDFRFGYRLWVFSSPSDIFSLSVGAILPFYVFSGLGLAIGYWSAKSAGNLTVFHDGDLALTPKSAKFWRKNFHLWGLIALILLPLIILYASYVRDLIYYRYFTVRLLEYPILISLILTDNVIYRRNISSNAIRNIAFYTVYGFVSVAFNGMAEAESDKGTAFANLIKVSPTCGAYALLKPHGSNFIAAKSDNSRVLIDSECKNEIVIFRKENYTAGPKN